MNSIVLMFRMKLNDCGYNRRNNLDASLEKSRYKLCLDALSLDKQDSSEAALLVKVLQR